MGHEGLATSPTFTLLHEYVAGRRVLYHLDFYRVEVEQEILALGWDDLLENPAGVVVVEWASKFAGLLPTGTLRLSLKLTPEGGRRILRQDS
jgi:tRNA threonylcarbamoyladenosine biosynthesis protein TsaE